MIVLKILVAWCALSIVAGALWAIFPPRFYDR